MPIVVISSNAGNRMGGEAIKAFQFFEWLLARGADAYLVTHARNRDELIAVFPKDRLRFVEDTPLQRVMWRSRVLAFGLLPIFHLQAAKLAKEFGPEDTVLHYLCPISPVEPRFPPRGYRAVIGPINGNITHPPGFRDRVSRKRRIAQGLHRPLQWVLGAVLGDKKAAIAVQNSGGKRTAQSLAWAGVGAGAVVDVLDAGVNSALLDAPPIRHAGRNAAFLCVARLVEYKAIDLAIRALAQTAKDVTLTIAGDGPERARLTELSVVMGVQDRVIFAGYVGRADMLALLRAHRALVFPSLAEANGIAMQEAMAVGLPVIALDWGGQSALADDQSAVMLAPSTPADLIAKLAASMDQLAQDAERANTLAQRARALAQARFAWDDVAASWTAPYAEQVP